MFVGLGKLSVHADREAIEWFRRSLEANRNHALSRFHFATALALAGNSRRRDQPLKQDSPSIPASQFAAERSGVDFGGRDARSGAEVDQGRRPSGSDVVMPETSGRTGGDTRKLCGLA